MNSSEALKTNITNVSSENVNATEEWTPPGFNASVKNILLAIVLGTLDIVTIFGNLLVILSFVIERRLLQPFNMFILNLAVTDFLVAITAMTFYTIDTLLGYWPFGIFMCGIWIYFDFAMTFASVFTLVAISVDRFWCVTWAFHFKMNNTKKKAGIIIAIVWFCVFAIWTPPFIGDRMRHKEPHACIWDPSDNKEFVLFVAIIGHYLPCILMIFCYIKVLLVMRRQHANNGCRKNKNATPENEDNNSFPSETQSEKLQRRPVDKSMTASLDEYDMEDIPSSAPEDGSPDCGKTNPVFTVECDSTNEPATSNRNRTTNNSKRVTSQLQREKRIFMTLTYVLSSYMVCWFPFYVAFDLSAWNPDSVPAGLYSFFFWSTYVNSTLNPFIYAYTNKEFRSAFSKVQRMFCVCYKLRE